MSTVRSSDTTPSHQAVPVTYRVLAKRPGQLLLRLGDAAHIFDTRRGRLYPRVEVASALARGYWEAAPSHVNLQVEGDPEHVPAVGVPARVLA